MALLIRPCGDAPVSSSYQDHRNRPNGGSVEPGTDYGVPTGTAILAAGNGVVVDAKFTNTNATGRYLTIDLDDGRRVRYLHLDTLLTAVGRRVAAGDLIARVGGSANGSNTGVGDHVHVTLWPYQRYTFGPNGAAGTVDFHANSTSYGSNPDTKARQEFLNKYRKEQLVVDGIQGPTTTEAFKRYQLFLKNGDYGYTGGIDGIWGGQTEAAHRKYKLTLAAPAPKPPVVGPKPADVLKWRWVGIQEMLRGTGRYRGAIDNIAGKNTVLCFQDFLDDFGYGSLNEHGTFDLATCKAMQVWLKRKYGYTGAIDGAPGPKTKAAWDAAERANAAAF